MDKDTLWSFMQKQDWGCEKLVETTKKEGGKLLGGKAKFSWLFL